MQKITRASDKTSVTRIQLGQNKKKMYCDANKNRSHFEVCIVLSLTSD